VQDIKGVFLDDFVIEINSSKLIIKKFKLRCLLGTRGNPKERENVKTAFECSFHLYAIEPMAINFAARKLAKKKETAQNEQSLLYMKKISLPVLNQAATHEVNL
jgi:hypothetical protein